MALIGVSEIWKIFEWVNGKKSRRDENNRKAMIEWLEAVHADLCRLSELWAQIVEDTSRVEGDPRRFKLPPELFGVLNLQRGTARKTVALLLRCV
jgi:hypothetical protein